MVAKVNTSKSVTAIIDYNERKCKRGVAECILASGFLKDESALSRTEKIARFTNLTTKNQRAKTNALHVPISFAPDEKLSRETLVAIATAYMDKIGFGEQPYLLYVHNDTKIQHMHIVSTLIQEDGKRIPVHNIGRNQSARARRELEQAFGLVNAETRGKLTRMLQQPRRKALKKIIDRTLAQRSVWSLDSFIAALGERQIRVQLHTNAEGRTFGMSFFDEKSKQRFKGSELGKSYSVNAILKRLEGRPEPLIGKAPFSSIPFAQAGKLNGKTESKKAGGTEPFDPVMQHLLGDGRVGASPEATLGLPRRRRKKKKRRGI